MEVIKDVGDEEINLQDLIRPVAERWTTALLITMIFAVAFAGIAKLRPKAYESTASIFVQQSMGSGALLRDLPIQLPGSTGGGSDRIMALLQSDTLMKTVLTNLNLARNPDFTGGQSLDSEKLLDRLRMSTQAKENKGLVTIVTRASKPRLAADISNTVLDTLGKMIITSSKRKSMFIAGKLASTLAALEKAQDQMRDFQQANDITLVEEDAKQLIYRMAQMDARVLELDTQLQALSSDLGNAGDLNTLVDQEVRRKAIQSSRDYVVSQRDAMREKMHTLPAVAAKYARIQCKLTVLSKTYELLTQQYQLARITQQGEDGDYQVIDRAEPKLRPLQSHAVSYGALGGLLGLMLSFVSINIGASKTKRRRIARPSPRKSKLEV